MKMLVHLGFVHFPSVSKHGDETFMTKYRLRYKRLMYALYCNAKGEKIIFHIEKYLDKQRLKYMHIIDLFQIFELYTHSVCLLK